MTSGDLISREALKEEFLSKTHLTLFELLDLIDNAPTVEQFDDTELQRAIGYADGYSKGKEERPQGEWIKKQNKVSWWYECDKCGERPARNYLGNEYLSRFCPNCGAEMEGESE